MLKNIFVFILGLVIGIIGSIFILRSIARLLPGANRLLTPLGMEKPERIGFLPYWLINKYDKNNESLLSTISYFALTIDSDGTVMKRTNPSETEPGWLALKSGKIDPILSEVKKKNLETSLVVFSGNQESIGSLIADPVKHAENLINEISPLLTEYGFTDLNLDVESTSEASESARQNFTLFTKTVYGELKKKNSSVSISIDVSPIVLFKKHLVDIAAISPFVDKVIFMAYDFHYQGSSVSGAVSPVGGAMISAEFDTEVSIKEALKILPPEKIILGVPLYGYEWETLSDRPRSAVIPGSGITASNARVEELLEKCASCSGQFDPVSQESYVIYKDQETNTFHQIFYPDKQAMEAKAALIKKYHLGGIALWAIGYEGKTILEPLKNL